tara:strand:- start:34 stop:216 length:183 start_codon:yes stop_codon:yes gene_type:complete
VSRVAKDTSLVKIPEVRFGIKDTDFLLKLIMRSTFDGTEIEIANAVIKKLTEMHRLNLEN